MSEKMETFICVECNKKVPLEKPFYFTQGFIQGQICKECAAPPIKPTGGGEGKL